MVVEIPVVVRIKAAQRILDILNAGKILELQKLLMRGGQSLCCLKKLKRNLGRFSSVANSGNWVTAKNLEHTQNQDIERIESKKTEIIEELESISDLFKVENPSEKEIRGLVKVLDCIKSLRDRIFELDVSENEPLDLIAVYNEAIQS